MLKINFFFYLFKEIYQWYYNEWNKQYKKGNWQNPNLLKKFSMSKIIKKDLIFYNESLYWKMI